MRRPTIDEDALLADVSQICAEISDGGTFDLEQDAAKIDSDFKALTFAASEHGWLSQRVLDGIRRSLAGVSVDACSKRARRTVKHARLCAMTDIGSKVMEHLAPYMAELEADDAEAEDADAESSNPAQPTTTSRPAKPRVPYVLTAPRATARPTLHNLDVSVHYAAMLDQYWEGWKEAGNVALNAGDLDASIECYTYALWFTEPNWPLYVFFEALRSSPDGSAGSRLAEAEPDVGECMMRHLPDGPRSWTQELSSLGMSGQAVYTPPNRPAAVCLANRAAVCLKASRPQQALADARAAVRRCPAYVKAHYRHAQALRACGQHEKAETEAARLKRYEEVLANCRRNAARGGWTPAMCLLDSGYIDVAEYVFVYERTRFSYVMRHLKEHGIRRGVLKASLVPFMAGQFLCMGLHASVEQQHAAQTSIEHILFHMMDPNGAELAEKPPHGQATDLAMDFAPARISGMVRDFETIPGLGFKVTGLHLGQGFLQHASTIRQTLERDSLAHVEVTCALITGALANSMPEGSRQVLEELAQLYPDMTLDQLRNLQIA